MDRLPLLLGVDLRSIEPRGFGGAVHRRLPSVLSPYRVFDYASGGWRVDGYGVERC